MSEYVAKELSKEYELKLFTTTMSLRLGGKPANCFDDEKHSSFPE